VPGGSGTRLARADPGPAAPLSQAAFDLNYGYFGRETPARPTLVDALGPWPLRVLLMVVLGAVAMTLFQLPWVVRRRALHHAEARGTGEAG